MSEKDLTREAVRRTIDRVRSEINVLKSTIAATREQIEASRQLLAKLPVYRPLHRSDNPNRERQPVSPSEQD